MEEGEPDGGIVPHLGNDLVGYSSGFRAARQDRQFVIQPGQNENDHHAVMALLDQKFVAYGRKLFAHLFEFGFGQREAFDIIAPRPERVGQHDLGGDLFEDRMADVALERVGR